MKRFYFSVLFIFITLAIFAQSLEKELFTEAENRFRSKDYELALDRYDALLRQYPVTPYLPDVQFRRAVCLYRLGKFMAGEMGITLKRVTCIATNLKRSENRNKGDLVKLVAQLRKEVPDA